MPNRARYRPTRGPTSGLAGPECPFGLSGPRAGTTLSGDFDSRGTDREGDIDVDRDAVRFHVAGFAVQPQQLRLCGSKPSVGLPFGEVRLGGFTRFHGLDDRAQDAIDCGWFWQGWGSFHGLAARSSSYRNRSTLLRGVLRYEWANYIDLGTCADLSRR